MNPNDKIIETYDDEMLRRDDLEFASLLYELGVSRRIQKEIERRHRGALN